MFITFTVLSQVFEKIWQQKRAIKSVHMQINKLFMVQAKLKPAQLLTILLLEQGKIWHRIEIQVEQT